MRLRINYALSFIVHFLQAPSFSCFIVFLFYSDTSSFQVIISHKGTHHNLYRLYLRVHIEHNGKSRK